MASLAASLRRFSGPGQLRALSRALSIGCYRQASQSATAATFPCDQFGPVSKASGKPQQTFIGDVPIPQQASPEGVTTVRASLLPSPSKEFIQKMLKGYQFSGTDRIA